MYIELYRNCGESASDISNNGYISTTPNPFETSFDAIFQLTNKVTATARIFDKYGMPVWRQSLGTLAEGKHRIKLYPTLRSGYHILNITAGKQVLRKIIVKKMRLAMIRFLLFAAFLLSLQQIVIDNSYTSVFAQKFAYEKRFILAS